MPRNECANTTKVKTQYYIPFIHFRISSCLFLEWFLAIPVMGTILPLLGDKAPRRSGDVEVFAIYHILLLLISCRDSTTKRQSTVGYHTTYVLGLFWIATHTKPNKLLLSTIEWNTAWAGLISSSVATT